MFLGNASFLNDYQQRPFCPVYHSHGSTCPGFTETMHTIFVQDQPPAGKDNLLVIYFNLFIKAVISAFHGSCILYLFNISDHFIEWLFNLLDVEISTEPEVRKPPSPPPPPSHQKKIYKWQGWWALMPYSLCIWLQRNRSGSQVPWFMDRCNARLILYCYEYAWWTGIHS